MGKKRKIIIVGAGIAGCAAAYYLATKSKEFEVSVLEARGRVGGRVFTAEKQYLEVPNEIRNEGEGDTVQAGAIDLGASWIHGSKGNPVANMMQAWGLLPRIVRMRSLERWDDQGNRYPSSHVRTGFSRFLRFQRRAESHGAALTKDVSVGELMGSVSKELLALPVTQWFIAALIESEVGGPVEKLSAFHGMDDKRFPGNDLVLLGGLQEIPERLRKLAEAEGAEFLMETKVNSISVIENGGTKSVLVSATQTQHTRAGERQNKEGTSKQWERGADVVIVTLPLGVLRKGTVSFDPPLERKRVQAMARIGIGNQNKVVLWFKECWWDSEKLFWGIDPVGKDDTAPNEETRGVFPLWVNLHKLDLGFGIMAIAVGRFAWEMEKMEDEAILSKVEDMLEVMFPDQAHLQTSKYISYEITRWGQDELSYGAFSFAKVGMQGDRVDFTDFDILGKAHHKVVRFAGEATSRDYRGTVHGAFLSGIREACYIMGIQCDKTGFGSEKTSCCVPS